MRGDEVGAGDDESGGVAGAAGGVLLGSALRGGNATSDRQVGQTLLAFVSLIKQLTIRRTAAVVAEATRKRVLQTIDDEARCTSRVVPIQKRAVTSDHVAHSTLPTADDIFPRAIVCTIFPACAVASESIGTGWATA
jgi:hypothetical protein